MRTRIVFILCLMGTLISLHAQEVSENSLKSVLQQLYRYPGAKVSFVQDSVLYEDGNVRREIDNRLLEEIILRGEQQETEEKDDAILNQQKGLLILEVPKTQLLNSQQKTFLQHLFQQDTFNDVQLATKVRDEGDQVSVFVANDHQHPNDYDVIYIMVTDDAYYRVLRLVGNYNISTYWKITTPNKKEPSQKE